MARLDVSLIFLSLSALGLLLNDMRSIQGNTKAPAQAFHGNGTAVGLESEDGYYIEGFSSIEGKWRPRETTGSWIGNVWVPPSPLQLFGPLQLYDIFSPLNMVWIGDSTGRRTALTLFGIINASHHHEYPDAVLLPSILEAPTLIDVNKHNYTDKACQARYSDIPQTHVCRQIPHNPHDLVFVKGPCVNDTEAFLHQTNNRILRKADLIVVCTGIWLVLKPTVCHSERSLLQLLNDTFDGLVQQAEAGRYIVWRTSGYAIFAKDPNRAMTHEIINDMNQQMMDKIDDYVQQQHLAGKSSRLTYVHWAEAVEARSFGNERIEGDHVAHYGLEPRLVMLQLLANAWLRRDSW